MRDLICYHAGDTIVFRTCTGETLRGQLLKRYLGEDLVVRIPGGKLYNVLGERVLEAFSPIGERRKTIPFTYKR